ncbi:hypothetical protein DH2020_042189 [Rehmannia glutinosa]|uniref:9-cis-epoxycarotenoid dioxygenase n=1 Tax=Rehmannia glutinosa TaxID=99300 RepID=A0ABR0UP52_REHGL
MRKPTRRDKIHCALHSPSVLTFPKQTFPTKTVPTAPPPSPPPQWNFLQKAAAKTLDAVESALVSRERHHSFPKTTDPRVQIAGNFAPVPEQPVRHNLHVTGTIPDCINGVYVRNGANPLHEPVAGHHLFDGDGMIHAVSFNGENSASYSCRFTETQRLIQERDLGRPVFPKAIGELHGHLGIARLMLFYARDLCGLVDHSHGIGVANAGLVYFNRRLLAMSEDDLPYQVRLTSSGDLETVGRYDFGEQLKTTMIAHPKIDPVSKELFALSYDVVQKPYLTYFKFSTNGEKSSDVEIPLESPTMIHDFAITENFVVVPDQQVVFKLQEMSRGLKSPVSRKSIYPPEKSRSSCTAIGDSAASRFSCRGFDSENEDDGYILTFVHDEKAWKSELQIINAMDLKLEASVKLPSRVPYGFHGTFISSKDLVNQA